MKKIILTLCTILLLAIGTLCVFNLTFTAFLSRLFNTCIPMHIEFLIEESGGRGKFYAYEISSTKAKAELTEFLEQRKIGGYALKLPTKEVYIINPETDPTSEIAFGFKPINKAYLCDVFRKHTEFKFAPHWSPHLNPDNYMKVFD